MRKGGLKERYLFYKATGKLPYKAGRIDEELMYKERMKDVARENYKEWGYSTPELAWLDQINNPTYDYRGYYSDPEYLNIDSNANTHWSDAYKTPLHESFSSDSKYSGKISDKNPYGLRGGLWIGDKFIPAAWQSKGGAFKINKLPHYEDGKDAIAYRKALVNTNEATYIPEEDLYKARYSLPEVTVTGKASPRLYMHPWKTEADLRRELNEYYYSLPQVEGWKKDLSKPLSPVDPVGEFIVGGAALNPAFKYVFGGVGSALLDEGLLYAGSKGLRWAQAKAIQRAMGTPHVPEQFSKLTPKVRTRLGDVEIDDPELYYHQSDAGKARHFVETGRMRTPLEEYWLAKEEMGEHIPMKVYSGIEPGYPQSPGSAMFAQGRLWYGLTPSKPDLLVTAKEMPIANKNASIMSDKASLKKLESQGSRRVTNDNIYTQGPHNRLNTSAYTWEPDYGYRRVFEERTPAVEWAEAQKVEPFRFTGYKESPFQMHLKRAEAKGYDTSDIKVIDLTKESPERTELINNSGLVGSFEEKLQMLIDRINKGGGAGNPKGTRYILHTDPDNLDARLSHELNHLLHIPDEPVPKGAVYGGWMNLYGDYFKRFNNTDIAARLSQVRDYYGQTGKEPLTEHMLKYAREHYEKDTGLKNKVLEMLWNTGDLKGLAAWGNKHATGLIPFGFIGSYFLDKKNMNVKTNKRVYIDKYGNKE